MSPLVSATPMVPYESGICQNTATMCTTVKLIHIEQFYCPGRVQSIHCAFLKAIHESAGAYTHWPIILLF